MSRFANNPARQALTRAVNRAIANGAPVYVNQPSDDILDEMQAGESIDRWAIEHDSFDLAQSKPERPAPLYARKPPR